jgi:hypothetical protein
MRHTGNIGPEVGATMKNKLWRTLAAVGVAVLLIRPAAAEISGNDAVIKANDPSVSAFTAGMGHGYDWANTYLRLAGQRPLYCEPQTITLTVEQRVDIMTRFLERFPADRSKPMGAVLLKSLQEAFPCK